MKKTNLFLAILLCLVLCVFAFASCGKKDGDATTAPDATAAGTTAAATAIAVFFIRVSPSETFRVPLQFAAARLIAVVTVTPSAPGVRFTIANAAPSCL